MRSASAAPAPTAAAASALPPPGEVPAAASSSSVLTRLLSSSPPLLQLYAHASRLKLYVYEPPLSAGWSARNLTRSFPRCATFQWSGDWELTERIRTDPLHATSDPSRADFYIVPFLSKCFYNFVAKYKLRLMDSALRRVLAELRRAGPWWERHPERHLFFFMSGIGAGIVPTWRHHLSRAVFVVAEGDRQADYFREGHDIVVPGKVSAKHKRVQRPPSKRKMVGVFRGSLDAALRDPDGARVSKRNRLRRWLHKTLEGEDDFIFSGRKSKRYVEEMDESKFCIIPRGNTPWTRRFFDAVVRGCIPAVLSDPVTFPYERFLDYRTITIKLPEQWAPSIARELRSVNASAAASLHRQLQKLWPAFVYDSQKGGCAFEMLLLELAARQRKFFTTWLGATPNTAHHFWAPGRGLFELPTAKKVGPSWGAGAEPH